jgi:hypothetical protein
MKTSGVHPNERGNGYPHRSVSFDGNAVIARRTMQIDIDEALAAASESGRS